MSVDAQPLLRVGDAVAFIREGIADKPDARDAAATEILSRHAGSDVQIIRRASGRPALPAPWRALGVSLSHRDDVLLCGFSQGHDVGVDIEHIDTDLDVMVLARDHFSAGEYAALSQRTELDRPVLFFRLWSVKEAILKATGRGIHDGVAHIDCSAVIDAMSTDGRSVRLGLPDVRAEVAARLIETSKGRRYSTALAILV